MTIQQVQINGFAETSRWVVSKEQSGTTEGIETECPKNTPLHREMKAERLGSTG